MVDTHGHLTHVMDFSSDVSFNCEKKQIFRSMRQPAFLGLVRLAGVPYGAELSILVSPLRRFSSDLTFAAAPKEFISAERERFSAGGGCAYGAELSVEVNPLRRFSSDLTFAAAPKEFISAERERFELSVEVNPLRRFSKPLVSASHPPLH